MSLQKLTYEELIVRLGVVMEQIQVVKRGQKEHPEDEVFLKGLIFFKDEGFKIMNEIKKRDEKSNGPEKLRGN